MEQKIEDFLVSFGGRLASLSEECFAAQVTALIKLKECEDAHLGEEVDRNWYEVATQQYLFDRLSREVSRNHQGSRWVPDRLAGTDGSETHLRFRFVPSDPVAGGGSERFQPGATGFLVPGSPWQLQQEAQRACECSHGGSGSERHSWF